MRNRRWWTTAFLLTLLPACHETRRPTSPPPTSAVFETTTGGCPLAQPALDAAAALSQARLDNGQGPLEIDVRLDTAALLHSQSMAATGELSHQTSAEDQTFAERMLAQGYPAPAAEFIAAGVMLTDGATVAAMWINDPAHLTQLLTPGLRHIGVGYADAGDTRYWTADFGQSTDSAQTGGCQLPTGQANTAPVLDPTDDVFVDPGAVATRTITAHDAEGDSIILSASALPSFATFVDNGDGSGVLTVSPIVGQEGLYTVVITASDATLASTQQVRIRVGNRAPVVTFAPAVNLFPSETQVIKVSASDPDGDPVTLSLVTGPPWVTFVDDGSGKGEVSAAPAASDVGSTVAVTIAASDGTASTQATSMFSVVENLPGCNDDDALAVLNGQRADAGLAPLELDARLVTAAEAHSQAMASTGELSHQTSTESLDWSQRILATGFDAPAGELIAFGYGADAAVAVATVWISDPAHLATILVPSLRQVGFGFASGEAGGYWTADLGASTSPTVPFTCGSGANQPPVANAGGNNADQTAYVGVEGTPIEFAGSGSDPDGTSVTFAWAFGDGATGDGPTVSHTYGDNGVYTAQLTVTDVAGAATVSSVQVTVANANPTGTLVLPPAPPYEGTSFTLGFADVTDAGAADRAAGFTYAFDCGSGTFGAYGAGNSAACPAIDNGTITVRGRVQDKDGGVGEYSGTVTIANQPPTVGPVTVPLDPLPMGTNLVASANFTDPGTLDTHSGAVQWAMGEPWTPANIVEGTPGTVSAASTALTAGVYGISLQVTDNDGGVGASTATTYVVVYDPNAGFVTGGGWITSPPGAYTQDPNLSGKATFGFVAKYRKGANAPDGNTAFHFRAGDFTFESTSYQWLVVAGARAQFKGVGTVNGGGSYGFLLTAIDGDVNGGTGADAFRIKVWTLNSDGSEGAVVYDNKLGAPDDGSAATTIGGGSIAIHG